MEISVKKKTQNNFDLVIGVMSKICNTISYTCMCTCLNNI